MTAQELGLALTRTASTETLTAAFADTDTLLDGDGLTTDEKLGIFTTRGWIIDVLIERDAAHLIGLDDGEEL